MRGRVQGVGFRPMVWRLARVRGLRGEVRNDGEGVLIHVAGPAAGLDAFVAELRGAAPKLARIEAIELRSCAEPVARGDFVIVASEAGEARTQIAPDAAICAACRNEILGPAERRYRYPFTNCTECGPRLSIVRGQPYDRANTTMAAFAMCQACRGQYHDPGDRRFHAQPIACTACGPRARIEALAAPLPADLSSNDPVLSAAAIMARGGIVALKGLGGFHLACDATNEPAVATLRARKRRHAKPFAVMLRDLAELRRYATVNAETTAALNSVEAPIVLVEANGKERLAPSIAPGMSTVGVMLPYTPLHLLLLEACARPLVMTSGNVSDEPPVIDNDEARLRLATIADAMLLHDRAIANRVDDSVVRPIGGRVRLLRRARGYAPDAITLPAGFAGAADGLALGGELKATFCLVKNGSAVLSQHIGDLANVPSHDDFRRSLDLYAALFDHAPAFIAIDRHPDYRSARLGRELAVRGPRLVEVQHHHAHVASCLAENQVAIDAPPVLGIALDGLGYGDDGTFWGGEFLIADYRGFRRAGTMTAIPMLGGAQAIRQPWRALYAHLRNAEWPKLAAAFAALDVVKALAAKPLAPLEQAAARGINVPQTSSCGRLFDAVAAALGICFDQAFHEGQAASELESLASQADDAGPAYPLAIATCGQRPAIDAAPLWPALLADLRNGVARGEIAARFHRGLAAAIVAMARHIAASVRTRTNTAVLTGGCFQNRLLSEDVEAGLRGAGFTVLTHAAIPANDGGIALGQAAIAAALVRAS